jgi:hypothetical protein
VNADADFGGAEIAGQSAFDPIGGFDPSRTPYEIREDGFPADGAPMEQMAYLLRYAILAPSTHNTQPWKFAVTPDGIDVYADYTRRMPTIDPGNRELYISIGAAVFNIRAAAAHFDMPCLVEYNTAGDSERPLASIRLAPPSDGANGSELKSYVKFIPLRHTNRNAFLLSRVPASVMRRLGEVSPSPQIEISISIDGNMNQHIGDMVAEAEQRQWADMEFRKDTAEWVRVDEVGHPDGVPGSLFGWTPPVSALGVYATRTLDQSRIRAAHDRNLCIEAPGLVVVACDDTVARWLETGETLQKLLLTAVQEDLHVSYFNMPVQVPEFRVRLKALLGLSAWPQLILRIGYSLTPGLSTPRRRLDEVVVRSL